MPQEKFIGLPYTHLKQDLFSLLQSMIEAMQFGAMQSSDRFMEYTISYSPFHMELVKPPFSLDFIYTLAFHFPQNIVRILLKECIKLLHFRGTHTLFRKEMSAFIQNFLQAIFKDAELKGRKSITKFLTLILLLKRAKCQVLSSILTKNCQNTFRIQKWFWVKDC